LGSAICLFSRLWDFLLQPGPIGPPDLGFTFFFYRPSLTPFVFSALFSSFICSRNGGSLSYVALIQSFAIECREFSHTRSRQKAKKTKKKIKMLFFLLKSVFSASSHSLRALLKADQFHHLDEEPALFEEHKKKKSFSLSALR
jgi:hypothetical protein